MPDLHVSKKTVGEFFSEIKNRKFVIPDYQRPYSWDVEKCETLWNDIENFSEADALKESDYFLGTIVYFGNDNNNQEIIDGQQRITSLMLLLRAFYKKLETMPSDDREVIGLMNQIAPCIWDVNRLSREVEDKGKFHITSEVATEEDNEAFHDILKNGYPNISKIDNYSKNYSFFVSSCDKYAEDKPLQWKRLCLAVLEQCIIFPIACDSQNTALTIFSTLNDRGMPLIDSDIFKAQIYRHKKTKESRENFTETWKELTQVCKKGRLSIDDVFRYYSHILRAKAGNKSKEIGLRKFYAQENFDRLKTELLISELMKLADFWCYLNTMNSALPSDFDCKDKISNDAKIYLHCLSCYPNEFWKYPVSVFFVKNRDSKTFNDNFETLLKQLTAFLFAKFVENPSVNAIKDDIYDACISIAKKKKINFELQITEDKLKEKIDQHSTSKISKALLLLFAYQCKNQTNLIVNNFEIEHIFPKKWQTANYKNWSEEKAQEYLERLGNKTILEKRINIQAGNGYFGKKKEKYSNSKIMCSFNLSSHPKNDWLKRDIEARDAEIKSTLIDFFKTRVKFAKLGE